MTREDLDLETKQTELSDWVAKKLPDADAVSVTDLERPGSSGFSNDTLLANLSYRQGGEEIQERLVIRVSPKGFPVFPKYDIPQQFDIMKALGENTDVPVPHMLWKEYDKSVLGEEFYAMAFVEGKIPSDNPPFGIEGFVKDASEEQREALWWSGLENLAKVHKVDIDKAGLDFLRWPDANKSPIEQHLAYYEDYFEWAARGKPQPVDETALAWLKENMPQDEPVGISWGDARIGNQIFQDFKAVAVIDWEMAAIGNPELDLAWWLFVDEVNVRGNGMPDWVHERLSGLPSHERTVARYEELMGRKVEHLKYYQVFAGFRFACVMIRLMQQQVEYGRFPEELGLVLERNNPVTGMIAELLEIPAPE